MNFVPIGMPKQQIHSQFTYQAAETGAPWLALWEVQQAPDNVAVIRFVPDLSVHLVFDLTGQVDLEPFLLVPGMGYVDLPLPPGTQLIGLHFGIWDAFQLRETLDDATMIYTVKLDADWVFYLYFNLLDVRNQTAPNKPLLAVLQPFQAWIDAPLHNDFRRHFFAIATGAAEDADLAYSTRHRRRLYQEQYINQLPFGATRTVTQLRADLAQQHAADGTCPVSTAIFLRVVAEAALEELAKGSTVERITPFWRVVDPTDKVAKKLTCGPEFVQAQREREGIQH